MLVNTMDTQRTKDLYEHIVREIAEFFKKTGFKKAVIGISGGIDSALVAAMVCDAIRPHNVQGIMLPSAFTSEASIADAEDLCRCLGMPKLISIPIVSTCETINNYMEPVLDYADLPADETEENIQARVRMIFLHAYSNKFNALVMNTCHVCHPMD